ncbi:dephospho-CoA kinase [Shewanella sp. C32]|uniref:Dephospho-CoA kinase n=1 Tax=Shewanella electrica TaxID=515560 RepID=A0ABT2FMX7_9GAMM|nr:dephospho-CoA kinase [Shewanella electrica]MCH1926142.1 dephospho-CoA kinase [Shewanella electrica]MCS4557694.1 dephospho-CoA kinase [Shewanella electrica]
MSNVIIGLTGGIGSGKSTVANLFAEYGIAIVDADIIARDVVALGTAGLAAIVRHFGDAVLTSTGELDRAQLRERIFQQPAEREWLNGLLHPLIRTEMLQQCNAATSPYVLMVVPLLFENNLDSLVDRSLVVDVSPSTQLARTTSRDNVSATQVQNIINSQIGREQRLARADDIIENQGDIEQLRQHVAQLHQRYLQLALTKLS